MTPLRIISAAEPISIETIVMVLYSPPGLGKTSTGYTAEAPLLLDTDKGSHRSAFRKDTVRPDSWSEIASITAEDVAPYKTLVLDTAGRALDMLSLDIISKNPKMGRGGSLTLPGWGQLKTDFAAYLNLMRSFGMDVVLIAHSDEKQQGDDTIERIDMSGSSKQEVYKSADAMGRLLIDGGKRWLTFSPTDTAFGKDPANLGRVEIPDFNKDPDFLAGLIQRIKDTLNAETAAQAEAVQELEEWKEQLTELDEPTELTEMIAEAGQDRSKRQAIADEAAERGWTYDKEKKSFVAPEAEAEEKKPAKKATKKKAAAKKKDPAQAEDEAEEQPEPATEKAEEAAQEAAGDAGTDEADPEDHPISAKQLKRFYVIAKGGGYTDDGVHAMLLDRFGLTSSKDLTRDIYEDACEAAGEEDLATKYNQVEEEEVDIGDEGQAAIDFD